MTQNDNFRGFDDGKAPDALRTIGEVAVAAGLPPPRRRYGEEQSPRPKPIKRSGGRRHYRPQDVQLLVTIDRLVHRDGYTLRGARLALEDKGTPAVPVAGPALQASTAQLKSIRDSLAAALDAG